MQMKQLGMTWWGNNWFMSNTSGVMNDVYIYIYIMNDVFGEMYIFQSSHVNEKNTFTVELCT